MAMNAGKADRFIHAMKEYEPDYRLLMKKGKIVMPTRKRWKVDIAAEGDYDSQMEPASVKTAN